MKGLQVIIDKNKEGFDEVSISTVGASVSIEGEIVKSRGSEQEFELYCYKARIIGKCDGST